jgi:ATP-binding cassette subfamily F protein 3
MHKNPNKTSRCRFKGCASRGQKQASAQVSTRRKQAREQTFALAYREEKLSLLQVKEQSALLRRQELALAFNFGDQTNTWTDSIYARFQHVCFGYSPHEPVLEDISLVVQAGARVAILGPNGAGKTTLLKLLVGDLPATSGKITRTSHLRVAYISQHHYADLKTSMNMRAVDYLIRAAEGSRVCSGLKQSEARSYLAKVGLVGKLPTQRCGDLSGGEQTRLLLASALVQQPHLLVLDEPTNHLDLQSLSALQTGLAEFAGGVICVSHHREFISSFANEIWEISEAGVQVVHTEDHTDTVAALQVYSRRITAMSTQ